MVETDVAELPETAEEKRREMLALIASALEQNSAQGPNRGAVIALELDTAYAGRTRDRVSAVLAAWQRRRPQHIRFGRIGAIRFAIVMAPIAAGAARRFSQDLVRSLDPRLCPLLRRALPYAWSGTSQFPVDGIDAETLLAAAEAALERAREAARHATHAIARKRPRVATGIRLQLT